MTETYLASMGVLAAGAGLIQSDEIAPTITGTEQPAAPGTQPATEGSPPAGPGTNPPPGAPGGIPFQWIMIFGAIMIFMIFSSIRRDKKERQKKQELLNSLSKNARVTTTGGMIGTVVEVKENEVRLRVDDATNTRIWFAKSAIGQVQSPGDTQGGGQGDAQGGEGDTKSG